MKDQYTADVNDYLKYSLLRALAISEKLGVVWMLTPTDGRRDGGRLGYLNQPGRFRGLDPVVFDSLSELVESDRRTVRAVEERMLLKDAVYFSEILRDDLTSRELYFRGTWGAVAGCSIVFFDPDNGLAVKSVAKGRTNSSKYLFWDELEAGFTRGHSIVVYQHFPRRARTAFLEELAARLCVTTGCGPILALATSHVAFVIAPQAEHASRLRARLSSFSAQAAPFANDVFVSSQSSEAAH